MNIFTQAKEQAVITITRVGDFLVAFEQETGIPKVPEVIDAYKFARENPTLVRRTFYLYMKQVDSIANLTEADLLIIQRANDILSTMRGTNDGASAHTAVDFIRAITLEQRVMIRELIREAANPESEFFQSAISELTSMMQKGHEFNEQGRTPQDGDSEADQLIWGHTQLTDPAVLLEFTICHFIERYMSAAFMSMGLDMADHKDWFLNALTDVIALNTARSERLVGKISDSWSAARMNGGLGWLKEDRLEAFREVIMLS